MASVVFSGGDGYDANVIGRDAFTDTAVLRLTQNNNTITPESLPSPEPWLFSA